jgi:dUTP pyrophosphatase
MENVNYDGVNIQVENVTNEPVISKPSKKFTFDKLIKEIDGSLSLCESKLELKVMKCDEKAILPSRATPFSVGYDLTAISVSKKFEDDMTVLYDTGIKVIPPEGYYIEILPRSSLSKTGYMLANSVGTIDPDYRGTLLIALKKVNKNAEDLELPFTRCQLILRKIEDFNIKEIYEVDQTIRGEGGFGSTDVSK